MSDKMPQLIDGIRQLSDGATKLSTGVGQYTGGVGTLVTGVKQAASGADKLATGISSAATGSTTLSDGQDKLATGLADGAKQIPSYNDTERANLAKVVASPISATGLDALVSPLAAVTSLLLVLALWLGALATYGAIRPVDARNATSSAPTWHLVGRVLLPGAVIAGVQSVLLGVIGGVVLGLSLPVALGVGAVLLLAGLAFVTVNHALAAWGGAWGRLLSLVFLLVTSVSALTYSAPGIFDVLRPLSPLSPTLDAVRAILTGHSPALLVLAVVGWLIVGLGAGTYAIMRSRVVSVADLLKDAPHGVVPVGV
jgi:putative membrane protein